MIILSGVDRTHTVTVIKPYIVNVVLILFTIFKEKLTLFKLFCKTKYKFLKLLILVHLLSQHVLVSVYALLFLEYFKELKDTLILSTVRLLRHSSVFFT